MASVEAGTAEADGRCEQGNPEAADRKLCGLAVGDSDNMATADGEASVRRASHENHMQDVESLTSDTETDVVVRTPGSQTQTGKNVRNSHWKKKRTASMQEESLELMELVSFQDMSTSSAISVDLFREVQQLYASVNGNMNKAVDKAHKIIASQNTTVDFQDTEAASMKALERLKAKREAVATKFSNMGHQMRALKAKINAFGKHVTFKEQTGPRLLAAAIVDVHEHVENTFRKFHAYIEKNKNGHKRGRNVAGLMKKNGGAKLLSPQQCAA